MPRLSAAALLSLLFLLLGGCALAPGMHMDRDSPGIESAAPREEGDRIDFQLVPITPALLSTLQSPAAIPPPRRPSEEDGAYEYRVGPQDVLSVIVWEHPELTIPAGEYRAAETVGHRVSSDGTIYFPYVGLVSVAGRTVEEIREQLRSQLSRFIPSPQLDIRVAAFRSQKVYVTGEVMTPGNIPISDVPLRLINAINAAGGTRPEADLHHLILLRGGERRTVSLVDIYERADLSQNLLLRDGDVIHVPDRSAQKVFVLGEVLRQTSVLPERGSLTLADALASAGGINQETSDASRIFVLRQGSREEGATVFHLESGPPESLLLASRFPLRARDVVFVSTADVSRLERVMRAVFPVAATLNHLDAIASDRNLW